MRQASWDGTSKPKPSLLLHSAKTNGSAPRCQRASRIDLLVLYARPSRSTLSQPCLAARMLAADLTKTWATEVGHPPSENLVLVFVSLQSRCPSRTKGENSKLPWTMPRCTRPRCISDQRQCSDFRPTSVFNTSVTLPTCNLCQRI